MDVQRKVQAATSLIAVGLLVTLVGPLAGCAGSGRADREAMRAEGQRLFAPGEVGGTSAARRGWAVMLERFTAPQHATMATARRDQLEAALGRSDLQVRTTSSGSAILLGSYASASDPAAQRDLRWAQGLVVGNGRPYQRAFLAPPEVGGSGAQPEFNLASAKARHGKSAIYTLQIGVWELPDRERAKREAEREVIRLRQEGQQAFYYHGRQRSMVTIGVFRASDYDAVTGAIDPSVRAAQAAFPHNLLNGETYRAAGERRFVASALVRIPD